MFIVRPKTILKKHKVFSKLQFAIEKIQTKKQFNFHFSDKSDGRLLKLCKKYI